ncbi:MAG: ribokinase [Ilumatobacteraceae bacterium]
MPHSDVTDVCVVGSLNVDLVVRVARHPAVGETVIGSTFETFLGGKGFNQAVAAARAGGRTAMLGAVGADGHGDDLLAALGADGIDAAGVRRVAGGTGTAFPVVDDEGRNTVIVVPRANHAVEVADVERLAGVIGGARVVLVQLELPTAVVVAAATAARRGGALVVLNPAPVVGDAARFAGIVDVVVPNESELALLTGTDGSDPVAAASLLAARTGADAVVVTLGGQGALVWTPAAVTTVEAHAVAVVDTVGAGDAFCGMLATRLAGGASLVDAVRHANAAGALATTRAGAGPSMPTIAEVEQLLRA